MSLPAEREASSAAHVSYGSIPPLALGFNLKYACVALLVQLGLQYGCWGFTVDDAWIVSRVTSHGLVSGDFHFNSGQPTDAVTPLGFAQFLAFFARLGDVRAPLQVFELTRRLGLIAQLASFFVAGGLLPARVSLATLLLASLGCLPSTLWAGAGLETPWVGLGLVVGQWCFWRWENWGLAGALFGAAIAWRPELGPYVCGLAWVSIKPALPRDGANLQRIALLLVSMALPVLAVALVRLWSFGSLIPLAAMAKAPDWSSGLRYLFMSVVWGGLLTTALLSLGEAAWGGPLLLAVLHLLALGLCGGDWMPGLRLSAPIYPSLLVLVACRATLQSPWNRKRVLLRGAALLLAPIMPAVLLVTQGADYRAVVARRLEMVKQASHLLLGSRVIATVDVGWVGISSQASIVDLGGVTDPRIGRLRGGHTNRPLSPGLFSARNVDTWIIRAQNRDYRLGDPLFTVVPVYGTDFRLLLASADFDMRGIGVIPIAGTPGQYVVAQVHPSTP